MAEFKLGRIRFIWKDQWAAGTTYLKDDIVRLNGKVYVCVVGHTADTDFYTDLNHVPTRWNQMSDGMQWRGDWEVDTVYYLNDIIKWGGQVYICTLGHTSAHTFELGPEEEITGPTTNNPGDDSSLSKWQLFAQSFYWKGDWAVDTRYKLNDIVKYGGNMYLCNLAHHSAATIVLGLEADLSKWDLFTEGYDWKGDWVPSTTTPTFIASRYKINDVVRYGGTTYVCNLGHTAADADLGLEDDQGKWDYFNKGFEYKTDWQPDTRYKINDIVKYGADLWICTTYHTSGTTFSEVNWGVFSEGLQWDDNWDIATIYQPGDVVTYGGYTYIAKTNHLGRPPTTNPTDWSLFTTGFNFRGDWGDDSALIEYKVGDVVRDHGYTYVCIADNSGQEPPNNTYWSRLNSGIRWQGTWTSGTTYLLGDAVRDGTNSYIAIQKHVAAAGNQPSVDVTGTYWNLLAGGQESNVLTTQGDTVYYGGAGPTRLPIGADGQVMVVQNSAPSWKYFGVVDQLYYVALDGVDAPAPTRGVTLDKPWKTVRYAADQIERGARNPNAGYVLKINRQFIQREVIQWITWQIANAGGTGIWNGFTYNSTKCERDLGYLIDAMIYDITHGGNVKTAEVATAYVSGTYTLLSTQKNQDIACFDYANYLIGQVLANAAPATNYQVLNGVAVGSRILQITSATAGETGTATIISGLIASINSAITGGTLSYVPTVVKPNRTILVKTGTFYETLPIPVPVETAIVGDELRSTNIRPAPGTTPSGDVPYSLAAIDRIKSIMTNVLTGSATVTASTTGSSISGPTISITGRNSTAGATPWTTVFTITPQLVAPPTGGYTIAGAVTAGFNGTVTVTTSTLTTITVTYGSDPGTWVAGGTPTITATNGTTLTVGTLSSGTIYPGMQLTGSGVTAGTYIVKNVSGSGNGSTWIVSTSQSVSSAAITGTSTKSTTNTGTLSATVPLSTSTQVPLVHGMLQNIRDYIDKKINATGDISLPTMTGTNTPVETYDIYAAVRQLELNRSFIVEEVIAWLTETYPLYTSYSSTLCQRDVNSYIDAIQYDLVYTGNYKSLYCARYYVNSVNGSLTEDMFYVRNGTGIRNMTVQGLTGSLGSANVYGTKRPSAGSYVSLDPGWGPNDSRVWVTNKSCYVQNVTTFGTACVGLKIDGTLHNGGNRSVVANDFTQVLSDGIGVWCTGSKAVTELVSVFSYYGHIGYLAENGGKIRATNGNSSYGTFGTVSEGVDSTETPVTGVVNNYSGEATVGVTVTNGSNIQRLEYNNAGTNYSSATYTFNGAGINAAATGNEIRDAAVFEVRILQTNDSSGQYGGSGYVLVQNVAQTGGLYQITLAATDSATSSAYTGVRIFINSGTAAAQQAYILNYNAGSKVALICKESFTPLVISATTVTTNVITVASTSTLYIGMPIYFSGTAGGGVGINTLYYITTTGFTSTTFSIATSPGGTAINLSTATPALTINAAGWDNVLVGTPAAAPDGSSLYTIEPRVTFTAPTFSESAVSSLPSATWAKVFYGSTGATYTALSASGGSGSSAKFDVVRAGLDYTVTLNTAGTGYTVGNTLTIAGTSLGGATPANDITIIVTGITNSPSAGVINAWEVTSGTAYGGRYVALPASGTTGAYSNDGATWVSVTLPAAGNYVAAASGLIGSTYYNVALSSGASTGLYSTDGGASWTSVTGLAASSTWTDMAYGGSRFVAIANNSAVPFISTTGTSWAVGGSLGATTTWTGITYGGPGVFVAVASGGTSAAYSANGTSWTAATLPASANWSGVAWGNGRFVAISTTANSTGGYQGAYSFDGITWRSCNLDNAVAWNKIRYGQGIFTTTSTTSTTKIATSEDGINWKSQTLGATSTWADVAFGNTNRTPRWVTISSAASSTVGRYFTAGATAKARVLVDSSNHLSQFRIYEPGGGYGSAPTMTITDPQKVYAGQYTVRTGNGALAQPTFTNRGTLYTTAATTIVGNGYADYFQAGSYVVVKNLNAVPVAGSNVEFSTIPGVYYKLVTITNLLGSGPYTATFQLSPAVTVSNATLLTQGTTFEVRIKYSQVRLTGHDFLSIGFGNFSDTNYPNTPINQLNANAQTVESGGGRCFYTATDQDGNFTVGTLFSVQQSTGTATLNASAFNLAGLQSLQLGSVTVGSSGATINEFSTDPFFTANSDSILPTQRAIKAYIASQIGSGSSTLNVNTLTAGAVFVSGNSITTTNGLQITVPNKMTFTGGIDGYPLAFNFFLQN
jgi:hypothetical protein